MKLVHAETPNALHESNPHFTESALSSPELHGNIFAEELPLCWASLQAIIRNLPLLLWRALQTGQRKQRVRITLESTPSNSLCYVRIIHPAHLNAACDLCFTEKMPRTEAKESQATAKTLSLTREEEKGVFCTWTQGFSNNKASCVTPLHLPFKICFSSFFLLTQDVWCRVHFFMRSGWFPCVYRDMAQLDSTVCTGWSQGSSAHW